ASRNGLAITRIQHGRSCHAGSMRRTTAILAAIGALSLASCSTSSPSTEGKYNQTWTTAYSKTTCGDYLNSMTSKQRWAMAADMLTSLRQVDGGNGLPADGQVTRFQVDVATGCEGESTVVVGDT